MKTGMASLALLGALLAAAAPVAAQTVYKLIDRNGKVTYAEEPPKYFDGQVIRIDIDPNANKATLNVPKAAPEAQPKSKEDLPPASPKAGESREQRLQDARDKLDQAKKALADARDNPSEDDMRFIGNAGGGVRRVPTEAYQQRLDALEHAVKEAENEVRELEKGP